MYEVEGREIHLRIGCFHDEVTSLVTEKFVPQGNCIHNDNLVLNVFKPSFPSILCFPLSTCLLHVLASSGVVLLCSLEQDADWLEKISHQLLIPSSSSSSSQHYRGIPIVLVVVDSELMDGTSSRSVCLYVCLSSILLLISLSISAVLCTRRLKSSRISCSACWLLPDRWSYLVD